MLDTIKKDTAAKITLLAFVLFTVWWLYIFFTDSKEGVSNILFAATYGTFTASFGGVVGLVSARKWGGSKSYMGRAIIALSCGLLAQVFGQAVFSIYNYFLHIDVPYPSLADLGFFGYMPCYLIGIITLAKVTGIKVSLKTWTSQFQAVIIPIVLLAFSYFIFLQDYEFDWSQPLTIFLDFGYPLFQAFNVSLAILTFSLTRNILGGLMKTKILLLIVAFILQYVADYNFLYQNINDTWYNAGYGDYLYFIAYFVMSLALFNLKQTATKLQQAKSIT